MILHTTNWLGLLKHDILERGSLYPGGPIETDLTSRNWLVRLRDDILERGSLYPMGPTKMLSKTNWLIELRDDILERGSLYPLNGSPTALILIHDIERLQYLLDNSVASVDGTDVLTTDYWWPSQFDAMITTLSKSAIVDAKEKLADLYITDNAFTDVKNAVNQRIDAITSMRKSGLKED